MKNNLSMFLNFKGNCAEVVEFYKNVFNTTTGRLVRYSDAPGGNQIPGYDDKIMYTEMMIGDANLMLCDVPPGHDFICGNNFVLTFAAANLDELKRVYNAIKEGGVVTMELQKTFFSEHYSMVIDKFGIHWNIMA